MEQATVRILSVGDNYSYLVVCGERALAVDASSEKPILAAIRDEKLRLEAVLSTHRHGDHVAGNQALVDATGCAVIGPAAEPIPACSDGVRDGDERRLAGLHVKVLLTPGHTAGSTCYLVDDGSAPAALFTGDTLFIGGCGRLLECDAAALYASLTRLATLPPETRIYCGHEYTEENRQFALSLMPADGAFAVARSRTADALSRNLPTVPSTLAEERASNVFMRAHEPAVGAAVGRPGAAALDVFAELRRRKDRF